jgi:hypothetical protein
MKKGNRERGFISFFPNLSLTFFRHKNRIFGKISISIVLNHYEISISDIRKPQKPLKKLKKIAFFEESPFFKPFRKAPFLQNCILKPLY